MKRLLILSGKGGTGKTTTASAFIRLSGAKAFADCDVDAPNLHLVTEFDVSPEVSDFYGGDKATIDPRKCSGCGICMDHCRFGAIEKDGDVCKVNEYACEGCGVCEYVCPENAAELYADVAGRKELYMDGRVFSTATLRMGRGNSGKLVTDVKMAMIKNAKDAPVAIIDGSPGIGCPVIASAGGMDTILMVTEPTDSGLSDLKRLVKTAETFRAKIAVCVNKWDISPENTKKTEDFCESANIAFVGKIPYDKSVSGAVNRGINPVDTICPAAEALKEIYKNTMKILDM